MPVRELYWNIESHNLMYVLFVISLCIFAYGLYQKLRLLKIGQKEGRNQDLGQRIMLVVQHALGHQRILKESYAGLMHSFIFYSFIVLIIGTILVAAQDHLGINIIQTKFFYVYKLLLDIAGLLAIVGVLMAIYRRYVLKPEGLDNKTEDAAVLILIFMILVAGFGLSGLRLAADPVPWMAWTPVSAVFAKFFGAVIVSKQSMMALHRFIWWFHLIMAFGFIAYIPYSKLFHIISTTANQFWQDLDYKAALRPVDFEDESLENFGAARIQNFSWKQLFDTEACTRCGRCQDNCPAFLTGKPLSPKELIQKFREHLTDNLPGLLTNLQDTASQQAAGALEDSLEKELIGDVIDKEAIWSCTSCGSCQEQCPAFVEHVPKIMEMRRHLVLERGEVSADVQLALTNMERFGNPWGVGKASRSDWCEDLHVPTLAENENPDLLYWVGCAGSFDARSQKISKAMVKVFQSAGINFSIIGNEEVCCGDSARRLGNEYLFQSLAAANIELLKESGVKKIVTHCPHCFNTLKNEYPQFGGDFEVLHHSQLLLQLLKDNKLQLEKPLPATITYHDSCYLGRYNNVYEEPRRIIQAIPQANLKEMEKNLGKSFCCGAGGGRMWMEETIGERINESRVKQALATDSSLLITGCPFCLTMMSDGLKALEEEQVECKDLVEVVVSSMKLN